jgi:YggT family protein
MSRKSVSGKKCPATVAAGQVQVRVDWITCMIPPADQCVGAPSASPAILPTPALFDCDLDHTSDQPIMCCGAALARLGSAPESGVSAKMIRALFWLLDELLSLYIWAVILAAIFSMLASFGVLDTRNRIVWTIGDFLYRVTEPALRPIRRILPSFGNIDLSPLILLLLLQAARMLLSSVYESVILGTLRPLL